MDFNFKGLPQLFARFPDDASARQYFEALRWDGCPKCPFCSSNKYYKLKDGKKYKCGEKGCYKIYSVTVGTVFESSRIPLNIWFGAAYLISAHKKGISSYQLAKDLNVTQKTAWFMGHRLREMMRDKALELFKEAVEIDEVYIGGKMKNKHKKVRDIPREQRGNKYDQTGVMGFKQRQGPLVYKIIDSSQATFKEMVKSQVDPSATVITDSFYPYKYLDQHFAEHLVINHLGNEFVRGRVHTNTIEGAFSHLKRMIIGTYHFVSRKHLIRYCDEHAYRYNFRELGDNERFTHALNRTPGRLSYKRLTGKA